MRSYMRTGLLLNGFSVCKRRRNGGAGLGDKVALSGHGLRDNTAVVLVAPDNQIYAIIEHAFWNGLLGSMCHAICA